MTESFWEPEVAVEAQPEPEREPASEPAVEPQEPAAEPEALSVSVDDFSALEERIVRAVGLVRQERQARLAAEARANEAEAQLREQAPLVEQMRGDLNALRAERDQVRQRVERLLQQLDTLEL